MASRKTKRVAAVMTLSASLIVGGAAFAFAHDVEVECPRGNGHGQGVGHHGNGKGKGQENGWPHKCEKHGNQDGEAPGGGNQNPAGDDGDEVTNTDTGGESQPLVDVNVEVDVTLPDLPDVPNALPAAKHLAGNLIGRGRGVVVPVVNDAQAAAGMALDVAGQGRDLAEDDVSRTVGIVMSTVDGVAGLADGSTAGGSVTLSDGTVDGSFGFGTDAPAGALTLGTELLGSTVGLAGGTTTGSAAILGSVLSTF